MKKLSEECKSGELLLRSVEKLVASLDVEYDPQPSDPSSEYCNAALEVVFLCRCVLREIIELKTYDLRGTGALRLAISLADINAAQTLFLNEIEEIICEDPTYATEFSKDIIDTIVQMKLGDDWIKIVSSQKTG